MTRTQALVSTLISLAGVAAGLWVGSNKKHPVVGFLLGSFAGSAAAAVYVYATTPPELPPQTPRPSEAPRPAT